MRAWLPIDDLETEVVHAISAHRRVILRAPTGSGKSTRIPQMLLRHGFLDHGQVVVLQPRRLAARLLGNYVAREVGSPLGETVGYQVRFENVCGPRTRIRFVTEGILLRQMLADPDLAAISVLIFDEFHERHLYGDVTLARALELQESRRPDLRIVVMSATLETPLLQNYLHPCSILESDGRTFPVEIEYLERRSRPQDLAVAELAAEAFARERARGFQGDALVFMPGNYEIQQTLQALRHRPEAGGHVLLPLHGDLSPADQDLAVSAQDRPKVIVSTNVAETSVTIPGVTLVIDSGLARIARYDPQRGINTLLVEKISQASADQRTGRAGRTAPGRCVRLWSRAEHDERAPQETPEVLRLDLAEVVLTLKASGVEELQRFRWIEVPRADALKHAEELLEDLGALDHHQRITSLGRRMLAFPVHPRYSRMLLAAGERGCVRQAALVAALTQGRDLLLRNPGREVLRAREDLLGDQGTSDFWILMRAWSYASRNAFRLESCRRVGIHAVTARQVGPLMEQFLTIARAEGLPIEERVDSDDPLRKCILVAFSDRIARRLDSGTLRCELVHERKGTLARESVVQQAPLLVAAEVREVGTGDQSVSTLLSLATAIPPEWIDELFPGETVPHHDVTYDSTARRVVAVEKRQFRGLTLSSRRVEPPPLDQAASLLAAQVGQGTLVLGGWDHAVEQWILRLNLLAKACPELGLPPILDTDRSHLMEQACYGALSARDLKEKEAGKTVRSWLSADQQSLLEKLVPERLPLKNGRSPRVVYDAENPPHIALRIQELYDVDDLPVLAMGRVPVVAHILAPNMRPVQVTKDLRSFWNDHYPKVRQELRRKYPKHQWR